MAVCVPLVGTWSLVPQEQVEGPGTPVSLVVLCLGEEVPGAVAAHSPGAIEGLWGHRVLPASPSKSPEASGTFGSVCREAQARTPTVSRLLPHTGQHAAEAQDVRGVPQQGLHPGSVAPAASARPPPCPHAPWGCGPGSFPRVSTAPGQGHVARQLTSRGGQASGPALRSGPRAPTAELRVHAGHVAPGQQLPSCMGLLETPEASYSGNKCTSRLGEPLGTATPAAVATALDAPGQT